MTKSNIKPFYGRRDNAEDPHEYVQDIEYAIKLEKRHFHDPDYDWDEDRCILFRQNLKDKAELWYSQLSRATKDNWGLLKEEFLKRYQIDEVDAATRRFQVSQRVATLSQGPNEHILDYLNRCEDLESQAGKLESFGLNVVQGIADRTQKQRILFNLPLGRNRRTGRGFMQGTNWTGSLCTLERGWIPDIRISNSSQTFNMANPSAMTGAIALKEPLPNLKVSQRHTGHHALHQIYFVGNLAEWPNFAFLPSAFSLITTHTLISPSHTTINQYGKCNCSYHRG
ncbi:hypothetical protein CFD26_106616 [Aspergillus turcosus]|uniref:Retrotransposon gag domain-containing protein n=1 Tax=Aspergillus turcosus TaxID=1245748 RepID=A0A421DAP2_9EURO|nr:hypothetical protein CFD26_106616 [Aspergillus turcosus]